MTENIAPVTMSNKPAATLSVSTDNMTENNTTGFISEELADPLQVSTNDTAGEDTMTQARRFKIVMSREYPTLLVAREVDRDAAKIKSLEDREALTRQLALALHPDDTVRLELVEKVSLGVTTQARCLTWKPSRFCEHDVEK
jgi:hypothetical protein